MTEKEGAGGRALSGASTAGGMDTGTGRAGGADEVPPFGAAESRRLLDLVLAHPELDNVPVGAMSVALADMRATVARVYGDILPELETALADPAADPDALRTLLEDLRYAFRRVDAHLHRVGWHDESAVGAPSLIDLRVAPRDTAA